MTTSPAALLALGFALSACGPDLVELQVQGRVTDATTSAPIPEAVVLLTWARGVYDLDAIGTVTGPDGRYSLFVRRFPCEAPALTAGGGAGEYDPQTRDLSCSESRQNVDFGLTR